jgi:hypothetical protein
VTEATPTQETLADDLKALGFSATAGGVLEGRVSIARALALVASKWKARREFLAAQSADPALRRRVETWCEKAERVLNQHRTGSPTS